MLRPNSGCWASCADTAWSKKKSKAISNAGTAASAASPASTLCRSVAVLHPVLRSQVFGIAMREGTPFGVPVTANDSPLQATTMPALP